MRAKARLRELNIEFAMPNGQGVSTRMPSVLRTIYLLLNEGYAASDGDRLIRDEVCEEALRLSTTIAWHPTASSPEAHALAALISFQHARRRARVAADGTPIVLEDQDRLLWDQALIARGFQHLLASRSDAMLTPTHLEAGIASVHAAAPSWAETDWSSLAAYYDALNEIAPSPVVTINRAVAISMTRGAAAGSRRLRPLQGKRRWSAICPIT